MDDRTQQRERYLQKLATAVVYRIRPNKGDRETMEDCIQEAWVAGLQAFRSADRSGQRPSGRYLWLSMQQAVYRMLHRQGVLVDERDLSTDESDRSIEAIDAEDFVTTHLKCLTATERRVVDQYYRSVPARHIAKAEGVCVQRIYQRLEQALNKLRVASGLLPDLAVGPTA